MALKVPAQDVPLHDPQFLKQDLFSKPWYLFFRAVVAAINGGSGSVGGNGQISLQANGTLSIQSDICPSRDILANQAAAFLQARVKLAPIGADIIIPIYQVDSGGAALLWATLAILDGTTVIDATAGEIAALTPLLAGNYLRVDVTQVGSPSGGGGFPGADLLVTIQ